ncbi:hypothetical protein [Dactylosporangium sp. NPDC050588]
MRELAPGEWLRGGRGQIAVVAVSPSVLDWLPTTPAEQIAP